MMHTVIVRNRRVTVVSGGAVAEHDLAHYGQEELTASATLTAKRRIGSDGVGFEDAGGADSTLIEACALALWQAKTTKRRPGRKAVVY